jgi:hypothetical protein
MSVPIAQLLGAIYGCHVHAEYLHPVLAGVKTGPGRRPELDFAVTDDDTNSFKCVLESKWVGPRGLKTELIIWDLLRLELVASDTGAEAFFLLAGRRRHLEAFFQSRAFLGVEHKGKFRRLLKLDSRRSARLRVDAPARDREAAFKSILKPYPSVSFPARITTSVCHSYPKDVPKSQYQAFVWRILTPPGTPRFKPCNHKFYAD